MTFHRNFGKNNQVFGKAAFEDGPQGGAGGGFMVSPGNFNSPATQPGKQKTRRGQNLVPVTIAQVHESERHDDTIKIGQTDISMVTIVGVIRSVEQQTTSILYEIDDLTGHTISMRHWLDEDEESDENRKQLFENTYVRVMGTVRSMQNQQNIVIFKIRPLRDLNELTYHILEVVHTQVLVEKGFNPQPNMHINNNNNMAIGNELGTFGGKADDIPNGLSRVQAMVYQAIQNSNLESGCPVNELLSHVKPLSAGQVREALEFLCNEGHIYSTIDEEHFKATDSG